METPMRFFFPFFFHFDSKRCSVLNFFSLQNQLMKTWIDKFLIRKWIISVNTKIELISLGLGLGFRQRKKKYIHITLTTITWTDYFSSLVEIKSQHMIRINFRKWINGTFWITKHNLVHKYTAMYYKIRCFFDELKVNFLFFLFLQKVIEYYLTFLCVNLKKCSWIHW